MTPAAILALLGALLGVALMLLAIGIANSARPGTRKRWLRAAIAAPLAALGLFLALKPAVAQAGELRTIPAAMLVLYHLLTDDRPYPVSHFKDVETCRAEAERMNRNPEQSLNERARAVGAIAVCFTPATGPSV